jgi:hypothetical protein
MGEVVQRFGCFFARRADLPEWRKVAKVANCFGISPWRP